MGYFDSENTNYAVGDVMSEFEEVDTQDTESMDEPTEDFAEEEVEDIEDVEDDETAEEPSSYLIDGEEYSLEDLREWKNAGLRQSDYTRKTQELAAERERLKDATTLYNYLRDNPGIVNAIQQMEKNPSIVNSLPSKDKEALTQVQIELQTMKIDRELAELHQKYGDFDEDALFRTANEKNIRDLETVVQSMLYNSKASVDAVEEAKRQLQEELETNKKATRTAVNRKTSAKGSKSAGSKLTEQEARVAKMLGLSEAEYKKWK